jgi:hypothetical protein
MKLVKAAAVLVGLIDLAFAVLFLVRPGALAGEALAPEAFVYPRWLGICQLASAAMLFLVASDPERYLPVLFINLVARIIVVVVALAYITKQFVLAVTVTAADGALAAILIAAVVYEIKRRREDAAAAEPPAQAKSPPGKDKKEEKGGEAKTA